MLILGFNGGRYTITEEDRRPARHDAAAVLLKNGKVVAAVEEERLDRLKHSNCFPENAIRYCLRTAGATLNDVDFIATNASVPTVTRWAKGDFLWDPHAQLEPDAAAYINATFQQAFGINVASKLRFCAHHLSHAVSAFIPSGFDESLVVALDGDGDGISGAVLVGRKTGLERLREFNYQQSLGHLYTEAISILGYGMFDEYKAMGLAPYGNPDVFMPVFEKCYELKEYGNYYLAPLTKWVAEFDAAGLIPHARRKGGSFTQVHKDFASALQITIERIILHTLRFYQQDTGQKNLCLAGGVAHNCTANGRILSERIFDRVFIQPAAHDAGGALGAALHAWCETKGEYAAQTQPHVYWGPEIDDDAATRRQLDEWKPFLSIEPSDDVAAATAELLANDAVVGWVQGRSEFGPRALGNRSILADPRPARNKGRINAMIKKREGYRPFAPSVMEERLHEDFEVPPTNAALSFMTFVLQVRKEKQDLLGAITHVDGSARVQTVAKATNHLYWNVIDEFRKRTGVPMVLNTSFNNNAEPIVDSIADAITCFLTTGLDYLVVGRYIISKTARSLDPVALMRYVPGIMAGYKLVQRAGRRYNGTCPPSTYQAESMRNGRFRTPMVELSRNAYRIMQHANEDLDFTQLVEMAGIGEEEAKALMTEMVNLWGERIITLKPPNIRKEHSSHEHLSYILRPA
jgi:carbamoyltransferase